MFSEVMRYILDLGPTVMLPIVIIIFLNIRHEGRRLL